MQKLTFRENSLPATKKLLALPLSAFVGVISNKPQYVVERSEPGLASDNTSKGKKYQMQRCSVHFAITQAFYLSLTTVNQIVDFCKYSKCAKMNIREKRRCGDKKKSCL